MKTRITSRTRTKGKTHGKTHKNKRTTNKRPIVLRNLSPSKSRSKSLKPNFIYKKRDDDSIVTVTENEIRDTDFSNIASAITSMENVKFIKCVFKKIDFSNLVMTNASFNDCEMEIIEKKPINISINGCKFENCNNLTFDFKRTNDTMRKIDNTEFISCKINGNFVNIDIKNVNFESSHIVDVVAFKSCKIEDTNFNSIDVLRQNGQFTMQGFRFYSCKLKNVKIHAMPTVGEDAEDLNNWFPLLEIIDMRDNDLHLIHETGFNINTNSINRTLNVIKNSNGNSIFQNVTIEGGSKIKRLAIKRTLCDNFKINNVDIDIIHMTFNVVKENPDGLTPFFNNCRIRGGNSFINSSEINSCSFHENQLERYIGFKNIKFNNCSFGPNFLKDGIEENIVFSKCKFVNNDPNIFNNSILRRVTFNDIENEFDSVRLLLNTSAGDLRIIIPREQERIYREHTQNLLQYVQNLNANIFDNLNDVNHRREIINKLLNYSELIRIFYSDNNTLYDSNILADNEREIAISTIINGYIQEIEERPVVQPQPVVGPAITINPQMTRANFFHFRTRGNQDIHRSSSKINSAKYLNIISKIQTEHDGSFFNGMNNESLFNYIEEKLTHIAQILDTEETQDRIKLKKSPVNELNTYKYKLESLISKLKSGAIFGDFLYGNEKVIVGKSIEIVLTLPETGRKAYTQMFINDSYHAHETTQNTQSCVRGIIERIYMILPKIISIELTTNKDQLANPAYEELAQILSENDYKNQIINYSAKFNQEYDKNEAFRNEIKAMTIDQRKQKYIEKILEYFEFDKSPQPQANDEGTSSSSEPQSCNYNARKEDIKNQIKEYMDKELVRAQYFEDLAGGRRMRRGYRRTRKINQRRHTRRHTRRR